MAFGWLREMLNPQDFYAAQRPILRFTFFCGMTPFTVVKRGSASVLECTPFGYINSSIHIIIFVSCYVIALVKRESVTGYFFSTEISTLGDVLQIIIGLVALVMTFFYSISQRKKLIYAFHSLAKTDEHFQEIGVKTDYKSTLMYNYAIIIVQIFIQATYCGISIAILNSSNVYPCITVWVSFFLPFLMMSMIIVLFICLVNQTRHRFYLLNKILKSLKEISINKKMDAIDVKENPVKVTKIQKSLGISSEFTNSNRYMPDVINRVASIQDELCDACASVEDYFMVQMLAIVTISFLIVVFDAYYILETIFSNEFTHTSFSKLQFELFFFYQATVYTIGILKIVYVSNLAVRENDNIAGNVHKLMNVNNYYEELTKQLALLSLQLSHRKVKFTAYGFFNLDFTLLFTVKSLTGAATTHLVILVQFTLNQNESGDHELTNSTLTSLVKNKSFA